MVPRPKLISLRKPPFPRRHGPPYGPLRTPRWLLPGDVGSGLGCEDRCIVSNTPSATCSGPINLATAIAAGAALAVAGAAADEAPAPLPQTLRAAGLFVAGSTSEVRPELLPFSPQYPLWSDGATKRRWIHLPPGTLIDASDPDAWDFPVGHAALEGVLARSAAWRRA